ncbi:MAG: hypothetical protein AAB966_03935, partial [Patescibacteria group bacterium]
YMDNASWEGKRKMNVIENFGITEWKTIQNSELMDRIQARILMTSKETLNPESGIKIFRYWQYEKFGGILKKLDPIMEKIYEKYTNRVIELVNKFKEHIKATESDISKHYVEYLKAKNMTFTYDLTGKDE